MGINSVLVCYERSRCTYCRSPPPTRTGKLSKETSKWSRHRGKGCGSRFHKTQGRDGYSRADVGNTENLVAREGLDEIHPENLTNTQRERMRPRERQADSGRGGGGRGGRDKERAPKQHGDNFHSCWCEKQYFVMGLRDQRTHGHSAAISTGGDPCHSQRQRSLVLVSYTAGVHMLCCQTRSCMQPCARFELHNVRAA